jgi:hypothetical protein
MNFCDFDLNKCCTITKCKLSVIEISAVVRALSSLFSYTQIMRSNTSLKTSLKQLERKVLMSEVA